MDSNLPPTQPPKVPSQITAQQLEEMKALARQQAIQQTFSQKAVETPPASPKVVYVRRNLTVAEVIAVFIISCGVVIGLQAGWNFATNFLPRIEVKVN
jgi:hypothetical protein